MIRAVRNFWPAYLTAFVVACAITVGIIIGVIVTTKMAQASIIQLQSNIKQHVSEASQ